MSIQSFQETLITSQIDGTANTAGTRASMIPPAARFTLPPNFFAIGKQLAIHATGKISCAVTTPGTALYDVSFTDSAATAVIVANGAAMNLNIVAKTNVNWTLDLLLTCRAIGTTGNLMWGGRWTSEAVIGSALPTVGTSGTFTLPYNSAPAVGSNFDTTKSNIVDLFFTQSLGTGSHTCLQYSLIALN